MYTKEWLKRVYFKGFSYGEELTVSHGTAMSVS